jgi:KamA family protein
MRVEWRNREMRRAIAKADERAYRVYARKDIDRITQLRRLSERERAAMKAVSAVLPFRVNDYVIEDLIDWSHVPDDPIFQLTFPQPEMLKPKDFLRMYRLVRSGASEREIGVAARQIQHGLNPHPAGQVDLNVPLFDNEAVPGVQHKYRDTVLLFPTPGQTCHAYCTYCFRWPQFVGLDDLKFASREVDAWRSYLEGHREVTSVLITGGDPMIMRTKVLRRYVESLLDPAVEHIRSIRIGSKALSYWPYRFVSDRDADDVIALFETVRRSGKHLAFMAHFSHPRELETPIAQRAIGRLLDAGVTIRSQAPLIRHVNDSVDDWAELWRQQVRLGIVPYYMFVERDTGARQYFEVPLARAYAIFNGAIRQVSGLARTVRGPSMSTLPGKVLVDGVTDIQGERVFILKFLRGRDPLWVGKPFFARFDSEAVWLDELKPAFGAKEFFYEERLREIMSRGRSRRARPERDVGWRPERRDGGVVGHESEAS